MGSHILPVMELNAVTAIVSGGASGLGEATARDLAAAGAHVVVADLNEDRGKAIAAAARRIRLNVPTRLTAMTFW